MATIQIRDVPDAVHRVYKARAAAAGQSLQEYLRAELIEGARLRTPAEVAAEVAAELAAEGSAGYASVSATAIVRADRDAG
jgi:antitoxin FitA